jgi:hypothetical protein
MKNIKYHTVPKSNTKNVERGKFHTPSTQIHECSLPWLGTGTSIKSGGIMRFSFMGTNHPYLISLDYEYLFTYLDNGSTRRTYHILKIPNLMTKTNKI